MKSDQAKVALVTGAAGGIGRELVRALVESGCTVCALDVREHVFDTEWGVDSYELDLQDEAALVDCFARITQKHGAPMILINNAAAQLPARVVVDLSLSDFETVIRSNLTATFLCCREFVKVNKGQAYGRIINIASTRYHQNEADFEAYGASKGGIVALSNSLCVSLAKTPITVNVISPGWIQTSDYEGLSAQDHAQHPSGRVGRPDDIARACVFLCDERNDFINGAHLIIDGGMTKRMIYPSDL